MTDDLSTLAPADAARRRFDALVVGAGPAGAATALGLARAGASVLLVERRALPRPKPCGGALHPAALAALARLGLGDLPRALGAEPLRRVVLACGGRRAELPLPRGAVLSRERLDAALASAARAAGAALLTGAAARGLAAGRGGTRARVWDGRGEHEIEARVLVDAAGLGGAARDGGEARARRASRLGAGAVVAGAALPVPRGAVWMAIGSGGYVGLARAEAGRVLAAAALDPRAVRAAGSLAALAARLVEESGVAAAGLASGRAPGRDSASLLAAHLAAARWRATPALTRRARRLVSPGLVRVGDAAGYVEPFTGDGIARALLSAERAVPFLLRALADGWDDAAARALERAERAARAPAHRRTRAVAFLARRPRATRLALALLAAAPRLRAPLVRVAYGGPTAGARRA